MIYGCNVHPEAIQWASSLSQVGNQLAVMYEKAGETVMKKQT